MSVSVVSNMLKLNENKKCENKKLSGDALTMHWNIKHMLDKIYLLRG